MLFTRKNFMFSDFTWKKDCSRKWGEGREEMGEGGWSGAPLSLFLYGPEYNCIPVLLTVNLPFYITYNTKQAYNMLV